jgi:hypothetical protein
VSQAAGITMGSADKFCLRWNDFESNMGSSFRDLRRAEDFCDVTLCCGSSEASASSSETLLRAHKVVLSACSPFFHALLLRLQQQPATACPVVYLRGVGAKDLRHILDFMYHGEVNVEQADLHSFLAVAEDLKIKGLTNNDQDKASSGPLPKPSVATNAAVKRGAAIADGRAKRARSSVNQSPVVGADVSSAADNSVGSNLSQVKSEDGRKLFAPGEDQYDEGEGEAEEYEDYSQYEDGEDGAAFDAEGLLHQSGDDSAEGTSADGAKGKKPKSIPIFPKFRLPFPKRTRAEGQAYFNEPAWSYKSNVQLSLVERSQLASRSFGRN